MNEFRTEAEKSDNNEETVANAQQKYNCHACKKEFNQFDLYISHFETCKDYKCKSCGKSLPVFSNSTTLLIFTQLAPICKTIQLIPSKN